MNLKLMSGSTNVVRFPVERRLSPSMELIHDIEPDMREVSLVGESFFLELPEPDLRQQVDAETAIYITDHILPLTHDEQQVALEELLHPVLVRAVEACRHSSQVSRRSIQAQQRLLNAEVEGGPWLEPLQQAANTLINEAAKLLVLAHRRYQEAHGAYRAISMARHGETWTPETSSTGWIEASRRVG